jgi:hypothetical protein
LEDSKIGLYFLLADHYVEKDIQGRPDFEVVFLRLNYIFIYQYS